MINKKNNVHKFRLKYRKTLTILISLLIIAIHNSNATNTLVINSNNSSNFSKSKIMLLRPCIEVKEKTETINEAEAFINVEKKQAVKNTQKGVKKNEMSKIDDLLNYLEEDQQAEKNKESEESEIKEKILFKYFSGKNEKVLTNIYYRIIDNLNTIGLYEVNYNRNSCQEITKFFENNNTNNMEDYMFSEKMKNNDYVVGANLEILDNDEIKIQLYIWDILDEKFYNGKYYIMKLDSESNSYRLSNVIADFIFKSTTGESQGLFDSKIIYVAETGSPLDREKQVTIMNFDGTKNTKITKSKNMKLTPIFSRNNPNEIFYMEYLPEGAFVVNHNLVSGKITKILTKDQSMTSAVNSNPNGKNQVILAGTKDRETNLFLFDFTTKKNRQITKNKNINTAPSFNPEGDKIVYVSDKSGSRKLYIKDLDSNKDELLTKEVGIYDKPAWSPDGKLIAFIKIKGGQFQLGVMTYTGTAERILTTDYLIEGVKWSPNSRYLIYTKQKGPYGVDSIPKIYIRDILTGFEYRLKTPKQEGASDPDWIMNF